MFAAVAARRVEQSREAVRVGISAGDFYHPLHLLRQVDRSLRRSGRTDLVVIDVGAFFVATATDAIDVSRLPRWVVAVNDRIQHLRELRYNLLAAYPRGDQWVALVETHAHALAKGALRPIVRQYPRPTLQEYESVLREAVNRIQGAGLRLVLQGPGGFNVDEPSPDYAPDTLRIYDDINAMARRVADAAALPMVDRIAIGRGHPSLFLHGTSRYSALGHRVMGEALAEELLEASIV